MSDEDNEDARQPAITMRTSGELTTTPNVTTTDRRLSAATAGLFAAATAGSRKGDGRRTMGGGTVDDESARGTYDERLRLMIALVLSSEGNRLDDC